MKAESKPGPSEGGETAGQFIGTGSLFVNGNGPLWVSIPGNGTFTRQIQVRGCPQADVLDLQIAMNGVWGTMQSAGNRRFRTISGSSRSISFVNVLVRNAHGQCNLDIYADDGGGGDDVIPQPGLPTNPFPVPQPGNPDDGFTQPGFPDEGSPVCSGMFSMPFQQQWVACFANGPMGRTLKAKVAGCNVGGLRAMIQTESNGPWREMGQLTPASGGGFFVRTSSGVRRAVWGFNVLLANNSGFMQQNCSLIVTRID